MRSLPISQVVQGLRFSPEIQELRHKSQSGDTSAASRVIDQSLAQLDERLNSVAQGVKSVNETIEPLLQSKTPTLSQNGDANEDAATLRKHATMIAEWDAVQKESQVLREELKEDKWLTVFRTVTDQADGMMTSLEKALNRCQVRLWYAPVTSNGIYLLQSMNRTLYTRFIGVARMSSSRNPRL